MSLRLKQLYSPELTQSSHPVKEKKQQSDLPPWYQTVTVPRQASYPPSLHSVSSSLLDSTEGSRG